MLSSVKPSATEPAAAPQPDSASAPEPATPAARGAAQTAAWQRHLSVIADWVGRQLARPRTRLAIIGVVLLLIAVLNLVSSVWTLPLVIAGVIMLLIAWIGARLDGRFAVEWGETGTQLEFRAQIKAPSPARPALTSPTAPVRGPAVRVPTLPQLDDPDVIEGEGHTVEIDVAELRALIVAAEAKDAAEAKEANAAADVTSSGSGPSAGPEQRERPAA